MSSVLLFVLIALALVAAALAFVLPPLLRARTQSDASRKRAEVNAEIYRQEVDELQQEVARGELPPDEARTAREDLRRRLIEETHERTMTSALPRSRRVALALAVALPLVAGVLYFAVGMPGALDGEETAAPTIDAAKGDYIEQLQKHLSRQPRDGRGWVLLARAQADRNDFRAAADAYEKALTVSAKIAKDPAVLCEYADVLGMTQGGSLAGRPAALIAQALALDPAHPAALEMAGSAAYAEGRYAEAVRYWKLLLAELTPGSERHTELAAAVTRAERKAAVALPPESPPRQ